MHRIAGSVHNNTITIQNKDAPKSRHLFVYGSATLLNGDVLRLGKCLRTVALRKFDIQYAMLHLSLDIIAVNRVGNIEHLTE